MKFDSEAKRSFVTLAVYIGEYLRRDPKIREDINDSWEVGLACGFRLVAGNPRMLTKEAVERLLVILERELNLPKKSRALQLENHGNAIEVAKDNYGDGKITAEEIAEYLLAELLEKET